jgi:hypothetical protein
VEYLHVDICLSKWRKFWKVDWRSPIDNRRIKSEISCSLLVLVTVKTYSFALVGEYMMIAYNAEVRVSPMA